MKGGQLSRHSLIWMDVRRRIAGTLRVWPICGGVSATGTCKEGPRPFCSVFDFGDDDVVVVRWHREVDRYGPFIHSGLDRPNHELNAFSAAEASASLAFAATEAFPSRQV